MQKSRIFSALLFSLLLGSAAAIEGCSRPDPARIMSCDNDLDCLPSEICSSGLCVERPQSCSSITPCPVGQSCCGGVCSHSPCCSLDLECSAGYCNDGVCTTGDRPSCSPSTPCPSGRCLQSLGQCVECIYPDDCPTAMVCSPDHQCISELDAGCTAAGCAASQQICDPAEGVCRDCVSSSECGNKICLSGACANCSNDDQCGLGSSCQSGLCVNDASVACMSNADCGNLVCVDNAGDLRCTACMMDSECGPGRTCTTGTCSATTVVCTTDSECTPPDRICVTGLCTAGCTEGSCALGQECSQTTGRCQIISTGIKTLGELCSAHDECASAVCWPVVMADESVQSICSQACSKANTCPTNYVCYELGDGNLCIQRAMLTSLLGMSEAPALNVPPGGTCGGDSFIDLDCTTGYCNTQTDECMEMCGQDSDCDDTNSQFDCILAWTIRNSLGDPVAFTSLCHTPIGATNDGSACVDGLGNLLHDSCAHGFCAQTPNQYLPAACGRPCCTPSDCDITAGTICKPIDIWDGIRDNLDEPYGFQKICLWSEYGGEKNAGELCSTDSECKSEICVEGASGDKRCTHTCCINSDCADYSWAQGCRPPFAGTSSVADPNFGAMSHSLGRKIYTSAVQGLPAFAVTPICMPR
ncbi:hypothetical protein KAI87_12250 [Myxococcota bacterium]|nr:hypothetical protein [Myxococcota bacterium]